MLSGNDWNGLSFRNCNCMHIALLGIREMLKKKKDLPPIDCTTFSYKIWLDLKLSLTQTQFYTIFLVVVIKVRVLSHIDQVFLGCAIYKP